MGLERDYAFYHWRSWGPHFIFRCVELLVIIIFGVIIGIFLLWSNINPLFKGILLTITIASMIICKIDIITRLCRWSISWIAWIQIALYCSLGYFIIAGLCFTQLRQCLKAETCTWVKLTCAIAALIGTLFLIEICYMLFWLMCRRSIVLNDESITVFGKCWYGNKAPCADQTGKPDCGICYIAPCADEFGIAPCGVCTSPLKAAPKAKPSSAVQIKNKCTCSDTTVMVTSRAPSPKPVVVEQRAEPVNLCSCDEPLLIRKSEPTPTPTPEPTPTPTSAPAPVPLCDCVSPKSVSKVLNDCRCGTKPMYVPKEMPGSYGGTFPCEKNGTPLPSPTSRAARNEPPVVTRTVAVRTTSASPPEEQPECICSTSLCAGSAQPHPCKGWDKCGAAGTVAQRKRNEEVERDVSRKKETVPQQKRVESPCPRSPCPAGGPKMYWPTVCPESGRQRGGMSGGSTYRTKYSEDAYTPTSVPLEESEEMLLPGAADRSPKTNRKSY